MTTVSLYDESQDQGHFRIPQFEVRIEGVGLPRDVLRDVIELTYSDNIEEIDSFELTVNNWDSNANDFKYVGAETAESLGEEEEGGNPLHGLFEPCNREVEVKMGYGNGLQRMMTGTFTTMEPNFTGGGGATLTVRGLNVLHQLRRKQYSTSWTEMKDSAIAEDIAGRNDRDTGQKRFPVPIRIDENAKGEESPIDYVAQSNQYDIDFLFQRARSRGYVLFVEESDDGEKQVYFGPSEGGRGVHLRDVTFELAWGKSLIDFKPTLTTASQIRSVTVNGWNRRRRRPISVTVDLNDRRLNRNQDLHEVLMKCDPREERVVDEPVFSESEARERAIAILSDQNKEFVKASGTTVGLPDLRAGKKLKIRDIGKRFSGTYFVTETTHTINDSGYTTRFKARREEEEGGEE